MKAYRLVVILVVCFLISSLNLNAQVAIVEFEKLRHDFGVINEKDGIVSYNFKFKNKGNIPLVISTVKATCGCTTPEWSKDPVLPGESGVIKAEYNPYNRPGVFDKNLTVFANIEGGTIQLKIHGIVNPRNKSKNSNFSDTIGNLRMQSRYLNFDNISTKMPVVKEFKIFNSGDDPI